MKPIKYNLIVEGSYHSSFKTYAQVKKVADSFSAEGWNVRIEAIYLTAVGEMGVS